MKNKLTGLYNTMALIETKGNSTLLMADCLKFLNQCIQECEQEQPETEETE